jgi:ABC-type Fe3+/spermidine/putrescine transport system ATPase subunit
MASEGDPVLQLDRIWLTYGNVTAVRDLSLSLAQGEFLTLLGPSGSGKTSTLRLIGGFERPSRGRIRLAGKDITNLPSNARDTATIFQSGALFPHKTVAQNIAYGLRMRKLPRDEIAARVAEILRVVDLEGYDDRLPAQMSGGQRQRVALARSLVLRPGVLLFDEPLSALDLSLRLQLRAEIRRLHEEIGFTAVFVTHDQGEAMGLSDRVAVMNEGQIVQIGSPQEIYTRPATEFVTTFIGESCVLPLTIDAETVRDPAGNIVPLHLSSRPAHGAHRLYLRPAKLRAGAAAAKSPNRLKGRLTMVEFQGETRRYHLRAGDLRLVFESPLDLKAEPGAELTLGWDDEDARWFS